MSRLMLATILSDGTVGRAAKYFDPSRPFSSAVTATNTIDRFGFAPDSFSIRAISIIDATPEASSIAPL